MARPRTSSLLLLSALTICSAAFGNAGRADLRLHGLEPFLQSLIGGLSGKADLVKTAGDGPADVGREGKFRRFAESPAYLTIKFDVPPHEYDNFVKEWSDLERTCVKDQGNRVFDLKKTVTDNVVFLAYSEWESRIDLFYHMMSDHFLDFMEFTTKINIMYELIPMRPVTDTEQERRATRTGGKVDSLGKKSEKAQEQVSFLTRVMMKPAEAEDFIDAWEDSAAKTYQEDGNAVYSLRQVVLNSNEFYIYGTWDSYADLKEHLSSKHIRNLMDYALDRDIVFLRTPLVPYDRDMLQAVPGAA